MECVGTLEACKAFVTGVLFSNFFYNSDTKMNATPGLLKVLIHSNMAMFLVEMPISAYVNDRFSGLNGILGISSKAGKVYTRRMGRA